MGPLSVSPARPELTANRLRLLINPLFRGDASIPGQVADGEREATIGEPVVRQDNTRRLVRLAPPVEPPPYAPEKPHEIPQEISSRKVKSRKLLYSAIVLLVATIVLFLWIREPAIPAINPDFEGSVALDIGETVPEFQIPLLEPMPDIYGYSYGRGDMLGRPTVLFVWASWAEDSNRMARELNLNRLLEWGGDPVNFVGLNLDENPEDARAALGSDLVGWPQLFDRSPVLQADERLSRLLGTAWAPAIHVFDRNGQLRYVGLDPEQVNSVLKKWIPKETP